MKNLIEILKIISIIALLGALWLGIMVVTAASTVFWVVVKVILGVVGVAVFIGILITLVVLSYSNTDDKP